MGNGSSWIWKIALFGLVMASEVVKEVGSEGRPIPGEPGQDYPIFNTVPKTNFKCPADGYFSDPEARCQVFHVCYGTRRWSFLCPNGTVFHQDLLTCTWWTDFDCESASGLWKPLWTTDDRGSGGSGVKPGYNTSRRPNVTPSPSVTTRAPPANTYLPPFAR